MGFLELNGRALRHRILLMFACTSLEIELGILIGIFHGWEFLAGWFLFSLM